MHNLALVEHGEQAIDSAHRVVWARCDILRQDATSIVHCAQYRFLIRRVQTQLLAQQNREIKQRPPDSFQSLGTRMQRLGLNFVLNDETCALFYRNLVGGGVDSGYVVVSALTVGEEVVATLLGIRTGSHYLMVRISNAGEKWSNCSPGRLIIERSMAALHQDGVRKFDFSVVNYAYKRRFGVADMPLVDILAALSWRGWPYELRHRAARELRRHPRLAAQARRMLGRPQPREEN